MSAIGAILVGVASKVGATLVKDVLHRNLGGAAGEAGGALVDSVIGRIAEKAGVTPDKLPDLPEKELEDAVTATEPDMPELILAQVESQKEANRLQLAEMDDKHRPAWTWTWRPATMWMIGFMWLWSLVVVPLVNAVAGSDIPIHLDKLVWLTVTYLALYMGGHTIKAGLATWKGRPA
jgi:hypothetical protein